MAVQNAGTIIREARLKAGLSQEKLSEGICSTLSLYRIEKGAAGVSPSTFQALMAHAGVSCEAYPCFANRTDFDCFYTLKRARFYLDCWQLKEACHELELVEQMNFAKNKFYYQEWLLLHSKLHFRSGCGDHKYIYSTLLEALHISRPHLDFSDFRNLLFSLTEVELLISIAQEAFLLNNLDLCLQICTQISSYLENSQLTFLEKEGLLAKLAVVFAKYLIKNEDYSAALKLANDFRKRMIKNNEDTALHELTFLTGLASYYLKDFDTAMHFFKAAFFSAHSIESTFATSIQQYLFINLGVSLYDESEKISAIPLISYEIKKEHDSSQLSDGTYDLFSSETLTLGGLIRELRTEQHISQQLLCQGLCSKSKLSKIENGALLPNVSLAQSLLQRLGLSDTVFSFYGSEHESKLHSLRQQLSLFRSSDRTTILEYVNKMLHLCNNTDTFYIQYANYKKATCILDKEKSAEALFQSLRITLPDFTLNTLSTYQLSWLELTILNNYYNAYRQYSPSKGAFELYKLLDYYEASNLDILEKKRLFSFPLCFLSSVLYKNKRFSELVELAPYISSATIKCSVNSMGVFLANFAQALGETQHLDIVPLYATYAYYNLSISGSIENAESLKKWIYDDFKLCLI